MKLIRDFRISDFEINSKIRNDYGTHLIGDQRSEPNVFFIISKTYFKITEGYNVQKVPFIQRTLLARVLLVQTLRRRHHLETNIHGRFILSQ